MADKEVKFRVRTDTTQAEQGFKATGREIRQARRELVQLEGAGDKYTRRVQQIQNLHSKGLLGQGIEGERNRRQLVRGAQISRSQEELTAIGFGRLANLLSPEGMIASGIGASVLLLGQIRSILAQQLGVMQRARQLGISTPEARGFEMSFPEVSAQGRQQLAERAALRARALNISPTAAGRQILREVNEAGSIEAARGLIGSAGGEFLNVDPRRLQPDYGGPTDAESRLAARLGVEHQRLRENVLWSWNRRGGQIGSFFGGATTGGNPAGRFAGQMIGSILESVFSRIVVRTQEVGEEEIPGVE